MKDSKRGAAFRREKTRQKKRRLLDMAENGLCGWNYVSYRRKGEKPTYVVRNGPSSIKRYYKNYSNRRVRRNNRILGGQKGAYRREYDLWWEID